jgi:hypothetical protein
LANERNDHARHGAGMKNQQTLEARREISYLILWMD